MSKDAEQASTLDPAQDRLAAMAVEPIEGGMTIGLGTGRAASRAIRALARRVAVEGFKVRCVATSKASEALALDLGLHIADLSQVEAIDYLFDGADEVDPEMRMLKGRGGAMTREKIAAHASEACVYMIDDGKLVGMLGEKNPIPVEVLPSAVAIVRARMRNLGLEGDLRRVDGKQYHTDNGNPVLDLSMAADVSPEEVALLLQDTPGVVGHGIFLDEADEILIEDAQGEVHQRIRD